MAEQAASAVASAVIGRITDTAFTTMMRKLRSRSLTRTPGGEREAAAAGDARAQAPLRGRGVGVSEKHAIGSASLLEWRDRLREAAAEGGALVLDFQPRAREEEENGEATTTSASAPVQQQPEAATEGGAVVLDFQRRAREEENGDAAATSASAPAGQQQPAGGALYFTRSALSDMAPRVRDVTRRLFSADEDMQKLDGALEKMERLSSDIGQFLLTLQLEVSPELSQRSRLAKRNAPAAILAGRVQRKRESTGKWQRQRCSVDESSWDSEHTSTKAVTSSEITQLASAADEARAREDRELEAMMLAAMFEPTLRLTEGYYLKKTDDRDMGGLVWLAEWAAVLWESVERGNAVLQALRLGSDVIHRAGGGALEADGELYSFARAVERVAWEDLCFSVLVELCPRKRH